MRQVLICCFLFVIMLAPAFAARKALIIGNAAYTDKPLKNPVNDAALMESTMKKVGFSTRVYTNLDGEGFDRAIIDFVKEINYSDEVFFYYSGHGIQISGENFLLPVGENIFDDVSAQRRGISLKDDIMKRFERARLQIIVLDACRDNPFSNFRSGARGLAQPPAEAQGYFILYSTSANSVADDGIGQNSDFTRILCKYIETPGVELNTLGKRVGKEVNEMNRNQYPDMFTRYYEDYYFTAPVPAEAPAAQNPPSTVASTQTLPPTNTSQPTQQPTQTTTHSVTPQQTEPPKAVTTPKPVLQTSAPKEDPKPVQTASLTPAPKPNADSPKPAIDTPAVQPGFKPGVEPEPGRKVLSRIRYGIKLDGGLDNQPDLYPIFNPGSFLANGDIYALWQYRQAWIKAGLTSNFGDNDYPAYHIADISLRIPLWIAELHAGMQYNLAQSSSGYDIRLEKALPIGGQTIRLRAGFGGFSEADNEQIYYDMDAISTSYYDGPVLYDDGLMELSGFLPDDRAFASIMIGNHAGIGNPYYLQDAILSQLPLVQADQGAYQLNAGFSSASMDRDAYLNGAYFYVFGEELWGYYMEFSKRLTLLTFDLSWKPFSKLETGLYLHASDGYQDLFVDTAIHEFDYGINHLGVSAAYPLVAKDKLQLFGRMELFNKVWSTDKITIISSVHDEYKTTRTGGTLAALLQYNAGKSTVLHASLGLAAYSEEYYYYYSDYYGYISSDSYSETKVEPKLALGIDLHFDTVRYRR